MSKQPPIRSNHAYFITFRTYGTWLHGDPRRSYSHRYKRIFEPNESLNNLRKGNLVNPIVTFSEQERAVLFDAIVEIGLSGKYNVFIDAVNVRSNHIHILVTPRSDITMAQLVNIIKNRLSAVVKTFPRFQNYQKIWTSRFSGKIVYSAETWRGLANYTLLRQSGGNAYVKHTRFAVRNRIPFDENGEPLARAFFESFITARVRFFRQNQLTGTKEDDVDINEGEDEDGKA